MKTLLSLLLLISLAACKTTGKRDAGEPTGATDGEPYSEAPRPIITACNDPVPTCEDTDNSTKMLCTADMYDGKTLMKHFVLQGFGVGSCAAREALRQSVCAAGKKFELVSSINCVKDPSDGECPVAQQACITLFQPVMCAAVSYDGRPLADEQKMRAWGDNSCVAQHNLKLLACKSGMRPSLLGENVECWDDQSEGECPVKIESCESTYVSHICKATSYNGQTLTSPLTTFGASECEAKAELQQQACNQGYRPSKLDQIHCQPEQEAPL